MSRRPRPPFLPALLLGSVLSAPLQAADRYWACASGDWADTCWSPTAGGVPVPGVPAPSDLVFLLQSDALQRVITYSSPTPLALPLAGLRIDASVGGALTLQQGTDTLAAQLLVVGHSGVGIVDHSGGIGSFADVVLGDQAGSSGFYTLRGTASLTASSTLMVGRNGWGIFVHHDSSQAVVGDLYLGVQRPGAGRL